jgi:hypothetical protein
VLKEILRADSALRVDVEPLKLIVESAMAVLTQIDFKCAEVAPHVDAAQKKRLYVMRIEGRVPAPGILLDVWIAQGRRT